MRMGLAIELLSLPQAGPVKVPNQHELAAHAQQMQVWMIQLKTTGA